jgi:hypothetical protein
VSALAKEKKMKQLITLVLLSTLAHPAAAQFGGLMDSLKKATDKKPAVPTEQPVDPAQAVDPAAPVEPAEMPFMMVPNMVWEMWDDEQKTKFYTDLRDAAAKAEEEEAAKPLGFLRKVPLVGSSQPSPNDEIIALAKWEDEAIAGYMEKDTMDRQRYMLTVEQEMLVVAFRGALKDISSGQAKVLRAFDMDDEAAALEADAALLAGACDTACLERAVKQSKEATAAIQKLTKNKTDLSDEGKAEYSGALSDFGTGTLNLVLVYPLAKEWGPRALEAVKAELTGGLAAGLAGGIGGAMAAAATPKPQAEAGDATATDTETSGGATEAEDQMNEAVEDVTQNMKDLLSPGIMVIKNGIPLLKDYVGLFRMLTKYGKKKGVDTEAAEEFDFGDF